MIKARAVIAVNQADAERELAGLRQQIEEARVALLVWRRGLAEAEQAADEGGAALLIEANEQLILAALAARLEVDASARELDELAGYSVGHTADDAEANYRRHHWQLREANTALIVAALDAQTLQAAAERLLLQQKDALAVVAHELRTPLTPIRIASDMLGQARRQDMPRYQGIIQSEIEHMVAIISDLLDVSRFESGKLRIDRQPIDLALVVSTAADAIRPKMDERRQHFTVTVPDQAINLDADPIRLAQILRNLLDNASKYTPVDGEISLSVAVDGDNAVIRVSDNGIGITAQALGTVFEPFTQEEHAINFNAVGLGLGLSVVRELIAAHGGSVSASSEGLGHGTEFVVTLPLVRH